MRKTSGLLTAMAIVAAVSFTPTAASAGNAVIVKLKPSSFEPGSLTVRKGTLVKFRWARRGIRHNVKKTSGPGKGFESKTTSRKGVNFKKRFNRAGKYTLVCELHPGMDMNLKVRK